MKNIYITKNGLQTVHEFENEKQAKSFLFNLVKEKCEFNSQVVQNSKDIRDYGMALINGDEFLIKEKGMVGFY